MTKHKATQDLECMFVKTVKEGYCVSHTTPMRTIIPTIKNIGPELYIKNTHTEKVT